MSFQWTFIAGYMYLEVGIIVVMMLPIASPRRWNQFFRSRLFELFRDKAAVYFYILLGVLSLFLMDAIREMRKYSQPNEGHAHLTSEMKGNVKLFRAQRNFYITGFAIFLSFVIRRLVTMIIIQAELLDKSERIIKEAEVAKDLAKTTVLSHTINAAGESQRAEDYNKQLDELKSLLEDERNKAKLQEVEANLWKSKYEELKKQDVTD